MVKSSFEIAPPMDDHDEYWDDEEHSDDEEDESDEDQEQGLNGSANRGLSNGAMNGSGGRRTRGLRPKKKSRRRRNKMKRMRVSTTTQDSDEGCCFLTPQQRGVCCIGSVTFLVTLFLIRLVIPGRNGSSKSLIYPEEPSCVVHDTKEPFSEWMHHIRRTNDTDLCREEIPPDDCHCHNPFTPSYDKDEEGWHDVFDHNLKSINATVSKGQQFDLVLYGDSIIERMKGTVFGKTMTDDDSLQQVENTKALFSKYGGGKIDAFPSGIAGDEIHTLMFRLENGEMPASLKPGAWWLMIGTNDLLKGNCNIDAIVAGIVTVAEQILRRDEINRQFDASHVVVNSLFPPTKLDNNPLWKTVQEINKRLSCYAETTQGIEFFNATGLLVDEETHSVNTNLFLKDGIHLSAAGARLWQEAIVEKSLYLIEHNS